MARRYASSAEADCSNTQSFSPYPSIKGVAIGSPHPSGLANPVTRLSLCVRVAVAFLGDVDG